MIQSSALYNHLPCANGLDWHILDCNPPPYTRDLSNYIGMLGAWPSCTSIEINHPYQQKIIFSLIHLFAAYSKLMWIIHYLPNHLIGCLCGQLAYGCFVSLSSLFKVGTRNKIFYSWESCSSLKFILSNQVVAIACSLGEHREEAIYC